WFHSRFEDRARRFSFNRWLRCPLCGGFGCPFSCRLRRRRGFFLLVCFPFSLFLSDFRFRHFSKGIVMVANVVAAEIENARHRQAFGRANGRAQSAEATLSHVDVERSSVKPLGCSV